MTVAKVKFLHKVIRYNKQIGRINLVYYGDKNLPHIEYELDRSYWGKGIMSKELKSFIVRQRREGRHRFIAIVEKDNKASIKLLEKNYFARISSSEDYYYYLGAFDIYDQLFKLRERFIRNIEGIN